MSGYEHDHGDCGHDYNRSWDYESRGDGHKPRKGGRRNNRRRQHDQWSWAN